MTAWKLVGAAVLALLGTVLASGVWVGLLIANLRTTPALPWAPVATAGVLWSAWRYANGWGLPRRTSAARRALLRARRVEPAAFALALVAGGLALVALAALWIVSFQTGLMRGNALPDFSRFPLQTVAAVVAMGAVVGAVTEEAGFRGYLQSLLERHCSPRVAILLAALALAPGHASTQGLAAPTFGFYLLVDAMLGVTAFLCDSILPGMVVHAAGLAAFFALIWPGDASRPVGAAA
ncbi:MAG TPA: CPBP family glutamic-type intramembrane protease, partial [Myxococcota bacterium]|nr:CPBP family glutamic-type intramembrane protease [Myxococcota bacterium]